MLVRLLEVSVDDFTRFACKTEVMRASLRMKPSGTPNRGNRATRAPRAIGNTQGWARACTNFQDLRKFAENLFFKRGFWTK